VSGVFITVMSIAKKSMGVWGVLDNKAEGLRRMPTSAGRLVGKAGRRLLVSHETVHMWEEWVKPARGDRVCHTV
jgi:hypothetical protein